MGKKPAGRGGGWGVLSYISHIGMCYPKATGMVFVSFWSGTPPPRILRSAHPGENSIIFMTFVHCASVLV